MKAESLLRIQVKKTSKKKRIHARIIQGTLKGLAKDSVKLGYLISKEEAIETKRFEESYLDDEVWSSSWDEIIKLLQVFHPETADLKPKPKVAPISKGVSGEKNGKSI